MDSNPLAHLVFSYKFTAKRIVKDFVTQAKLRKLTPQHTPFADEWGDGKLRCVQCEVLYPCPTIKKLGCKTLREVQAYGFHR